MRFFFDVYDDLTSLDEEGLEFPNLDAAVRDARKAARELICEQVRSGQLHLHHRIEVGDEARRPVATIHFRDVVEVRP